VSDVAAANLAALGVEAPAGSARPVNVCSGHPVTIGAVAAALADAFGPGAPRPVITGRYRLGDVRHVVASPNLAESWLGFRAQVTLADGLARLTRE
jgi:dTDP-L-rhamnose 4-epimerase